MERIIRYSAWTFVAAHVAVAVALLASSSGPLFHNDYSLMIYQQHKAVEFFGAAQNLWGYDPSYAAGYPLNFTWNSNAILQFLAVLLHPVPEYVVLLVTTVASVLSAPLLFWLGLGNFGLSGSRRALGIILMLAYWWSGLPVVFFLLGMPSALLVFHLSFYIVSLFYRILSENDASVIPRLYLLVPLCFLAHKTALVTLGVPVVILFLCYLRRVNLKLVAHLAAIGALTIAVNSFWLLPFLDLVKFKVTLADAPHGLHYDPLRVFKDYFTFSKIMGHVVKTAGDSGVLVVPNTITRNILLWFGIHGMIVQWRSGRRAAAVFFGVTAAVFIAEIYFGSFWKPTAMLYPTRYVGYLDSLLTIPAIVGVFALWSKLAQWPKLRASAVRFAKPALLLLLIGTLPSYVLFSSLTASRLDDDTRSLTIWLQKNATSDGRVMLEDSGWNDRDGLPPRYSESHFPSLLADLTGSEFIGGPYPYLFLAHHYADFHDGKFLGKDIDDYETSELLDALRRYHVRWTVCWSDSCNGVFSGVPSEFSRVSSVGKFTVYEYANFDPNPFLAGDGFVIADYAGIRCYRVRPESGRAVLKYHAFSGLVTSGGARTTTARSGADPIGFIEIRNPTPYFKIFNDYSLETYHK